jgi:hypothetical protein
MTINVHIFE